MTFAPDPTVLGAALCELVGLGTELDSVRLQLVAQCESNGVADSIGVRTIGHCVAARTDSTSKGTNQDATLARWLRDFPLFSEALERRDLTVEHLQYVRSKLDNDRTHHALKDDQQFFADLGSGLDFKGFGTACEYWTAHVDPDGEEPLDQLEKIWCQHQGRVWWPHHNHHQLRRCVWFGVRPG